MQSGPYGNKVLSASEIEDLLSGRTASAVTGSPPTAPSSGNALHNPHTTEVASSIARLWNDTFDPYNRTRFRELYLYDELSFYQDYNESYRTNPFTFMLVESVVTNILGDGYHFEGPGANVIEQFFWEDNTRTKLEMVLRDTVTLGNGIMDFRFKSQRIVETRPIGASNILISIDTNKNSSTYGQRKYYQVKNEPLDEDYIFHLMLKPHTESAYGMSLIRPNIIFLQGLLDSGGDVLAAIKRIGYAPIVAKLDLDGYRTEAEKRAALQAFTDDLKKTESSDQNFAIDRRHDINLLGAGSAGARLLPINDLIEPWIAVCLRNFGFPIGIFLQQGANKAIVDAQREDVRVVFQSFKAKFKYEVERHVLPRITNREVELIWDKAPPYTAETQASMKIFLLAYQLGLISKEYILDNFDIEDTGKSFYEGNPTQGASHDISASEVENNG